MSDTTNATKDKGFHINTSGISCIPCRCKRQFYHKETKTIKEDNKITTNTIVDKRNTRFGGGRHASPDDIFKPDSDLQAGSIELCNTGWGETRITPEELEERVERLETDINLMKKDIEHINKIKLKSD